MADHLALVISQRHPAIMRRPTVATWQRQRLTEDQIRLLRGLIDVSTGRVVQGVTVAAATVVKTITLGNHASKGTGRGLLGLTNPDLLSLQHQTELGHQLIKEGPPRLG